MREGITMTAPEKIQREYFAWQPQDDPEFAPLICGRGAIGGKGRSLLFALRKLRESGDSQLQSTQIPQSVYFSVELFHQFLESVPRLELLIQRGEPDELLAAFNAVPMPAALTETVRRFLSAVSDPVVIRSSSVLEDSLKYSFAGKYMTTFFGNNEGSLEERVRRVEGEIRRIYACTYFPKAVSYRKRHGLPDDDMGIMLMRIVGTWRGEYYYPTVGGVGYSRNFRRWSPRVKQEDGVLRLVFGLPTMSTKRGYARTLSLTNPRLRPEGQNPDKIAFHAQESFHVLARNVPGEITTLDIKKCWRQLIDYHPDFDAYAQLYSYDDDHGSFSPLMKNMMTMQPLSKVCFTFENFPRRYPGFYERMKKMLALLENAMGIAADVEFSCEPLPGQFYLLQSRPFWNGSVGGDGLPDLTDRRVILKTDRMFTQGRLEKVKALVYVDNAAYYLSPDFHAVARTIGQVNDRLGEPYILVSPGRIGSSNPVLGVPVQYNELTNCRCMVELGIPKLGFMPELSYGTHFFSDLEIDNVLYMPVFDGEPENLFDERWFENHPWEPTADPAVRIYRGDFSAYMETSANQAVIVDNSWDGSKGDQRTAPSWAVDDR